MATFDRSPPLAMACDEFNECGPCSRGGRTKEGKYYCIDCPDYLCGDCKDYHGNLAVTRNHTFLPVARVRYLPVKGSALTLHVVATKVSRSHSIALTTNISSV